MGKSTLAAPTIPIDSEWWKPGAAEAKKQRPRQRHQQRGSVRSQATKVSPNARNSHEVAPMPARSTARSFYVFDAAVREFRTPLARGPPLARALPSPPSPSLSSTPPKGHKAESTRRPRLRRSPARRRDAPERQSGARAACERRTRVAHASGARAAAPEGPRDPSPPALIRQAACCAIPIAWLSAARSSTPAALDNRSLLMPLGLQGVSLSLLEGLAHYRSTTTHGSSPCRPPLQAQPLPTAKHSCRSDLATRGRRSRQRAAPHPSGARAARTNAVRAAP